MYKLYRSDYALIMYHLLLKVFFLYGNIACCHSNKTRHVNIRTVFPGSQTGNSSCSTILVHGKNPCTLDKKNQSIGICHLLALRLKIKSE